MPTSHHRLVGTLLKGGCSMRPSSDEFGLVTRRMFLGLLGTTIIAGCTRGNKKPNNSEYLTTAAELIDKDLFLIAHRGSGDNWTEHTLKAYQQALIHGASAIEISVHRTSDGHFVCHHDPDLLRLCGEPKQISELTWTQLKEYSNDARRWLGPNTPLEPIARLDEVMATLGGKTVFFIEDKTGKNAIDLLKILLDSPAPAESLVWKQPASSQGHEVASSKGIKTWGYFSPEYFSEIELLSSKFDLIGIHDSADTTTIRRAVSTGKPVVCWEVHSRSKMDALQRQGVRGMMCSNYPYVSTEPQLDRSATDEFSTGRRSAGDLPDKLLWNEQPEIDALQGLIRLSGQRKSGYVLGSMAVATIGSWNLKAQMHWPLLGASNQIAGIAFGLPDDVPYRAFEANQIVGYHLQLESKGRASIWEAAGKEPRRLAEVPLNVPKAGEWLHIEFEFVRDGIQVQIDSVRFVAKVSKNIQSGYLNLLNLIPHGNPVEFKEISLQYT